MGTSDLFRNLEWQIETYLAPKTIEYLRKNWSSDISPEENLTRAVTSVVPYIFENHNKWAEKRGEQDRDDDTDVSNSGNHTGDDSKLVELAKKQIQELRSKDSP